MSKQFSLDDSSPVVVIGSGAGGGVLANELAQRGIDVVCLEAGRRLAPGDIVNDEAAMFGKLTWQIANAIASLMESDERRQELAELGVKRAADFAWPAAAEKTLETYESALRMRSWRPGLRRGADR